MSAMMLPGLVGEPALPVTVPAATEDRLVPLASVRATARRRGAEIREIDGVGHSMTSTHVPYRREEMMNHA